MAIKYKQIPKAFNPSITEASYLLRSKLLKSIAKMAPFMKGRMMDFGCGSKPYKSIFETKEYIGVDFHGEGHSHENEKIDVFYDGHTLPFPSDHFDSIFSSEVFEHVFNLEEIIPEIKRVMKPGGFILVTCPFAIAEHEQPNDFARYSSFAIKHLFSKHDFEIIHYEKIGNEFETIMQLWIIYFYMRILAKLNRLIIIRPILDPLLISFFNFLTICINKIIPSKEDLYMNNLILCKKK
ncbi:MAG: methyltransferase domain-containing protein [Bacteroidota bacterium]